MTVLPGWGATKMPPYPWWAQGVDRREEGTAATYEAACNAAQLAYARLNPKAVGQ